MRCTARLVRVVPSTRCEDPVATAVYCSRTRVSVLTVASRAVGVGRDARYRRSAIAGVSVELCEDVKSYGRAAIWN